MSKTEQQLINNIIGQLNGVKKMMDQDEFCFDVLAQMKAARSAMNSVMSKYMEKNFWKMMNECDDKEEFCKKFMAEFVKNSN